MNEISCHRPESVGFALGVTSLQRKLRALSRALRAEQYTMKDFTKDAKDEVVNISVLPHEEF